MATTTLVSSGRPSRSRLLSMGLKALWTAALGDPLGASGGTKAIPGNLGSSKARPARSKAAESCLFNIGGLPVKQSRTPKGYGNSCRGGRNGGAREGLAAGRQIIKALILLDKIAAPEGGPLLATSHGEDVSKGLPVVGRTSDVVA